MQNAKPEPIDIPLALYLQGEAVVDPDVKGQHPLFYGTISGLKGYRRDLHAYIKVLPAERLFAETMSASIGRYFGLPIPLTALAVARGKDVGRGHGKCIVLASVDTNAVPMSRVINFDKVSHLLNKWSHLHAAIVFDELLANTDRNLRNLLIGGDGAIWLIDHEEALSAPSLQASENIRNHLLGMVIGEVSEFERHQASKKLKDRSAPAYTANFRKHAAASQPHYCQVDQAHVDKVVDFLESRVKHMSALMDGALGFKQKTMAV
jgi:hypothetical protein